MLQKRMRQDVCRLLLVQAVWLCAFFLLFLCLSFMHHEAFAQLALPSEEQTKKVKKRPARPPEEIPSIEILGHEVLSRHAAQKQVESSLPLPESINTEAAQAAIQGRVRLRPPVHAPTRGLKEAPVTIIELSDLGCLECLKFFKDAEKIFAKLKEPQKNKVRWVHVHMPSDLYNSTNPAAFYGKLAQHNHIFWDYRAKLLELKKLPDGVFVDALIQAGGDPYRDKNVIRKNARKFYQQLDAEALMARKTGEGVPSVLFINGVKIGESIPLEHIGDFIGYEILRVEAKAGL